MKPSDKIKAFTLSEVLVVLVITTIVIAIAFSVLNLVSQQLGAIRNSYENRTTIAKFKQRLLLDMDRSDQLYWDETTELLEISTGEETIVYEFINDYVIRSTDTIALEIKNAILYHKGVSVEEGIIDAINIAIAQPGGVIELFVSRTPGAQEQLGKRWD